MNVIKKANKNFEKKYVKNIKIFMKKKRKRVEKGPRQISKSF